MAGPAIAYAVTRGIHGGYGVLAVVTGRAGAQDFADHHNLTTDRYSGMTAPRSRKSAYTAPGGASPIRVTERECAMFGITDFRWFNDRQARGARAACHAAHEALHDNSDDERAAGVTDETGEYHRLNRIANEAAAALTNARP